MSDYVPGLQKNREERLLTLKRKFWQGATPAVFCLANQHLDFAGHNYLFYTPRKVETFDAAENLAYSGDLELCLKDDSETD